MFTVRDRWTGDLFDRWSELGEKRRRMLDRSWAGVFRHHLLSHLPVDELCRHFDRHQGRPSKDLHVVIGVMILQQLHDLTDARAVEGVAFNMMWHYALDVGSEDEAYLCEKSLRNYRRLVIDNGLDEVLFRCLTDRLISAFRVDVGRQRLDSTSLRSATRSLTRLGIVVETIAKFLRALKLAFPTLHAGIDRDLIRRYVDREGDGCFADTTPSTSRRRLPEAGRDLLNLVTMFRDTDAAGLESFGLLERVLDEQFEVLPAGDDTKGGAKLRLKEPRDIPCDNVRNPADPDSSYNKHHGQGYMAQVMETYQEDDERSPEAVVQHPDLITHVAVHKMTVHDGHHLDTALSDVMERGAKPDMVLADSHYGSVDNVESARTRDIELISPAQTPKGARDGRVTLEDFELDENGLIRACPAGVVPHSSTAGQQRLQARFPLSACQACEENERCLINIDKAKGSFVRFQYTHARVEQRKRRLKDQSGAFKKRYRWRAGVEATMSRLKHQMGLAHLRVRGMARIEYVTLLRALGLNVLRCAAVPATG